jgi:glyoxylate reductase
MAITPDRIDLATATARKIPVTVIPPVVAEATADICFGLMLAVARRMVEGDHLVHRGIFPGAQSNHLAGAWVWGKTVGLVGGKGRIGQAVARRAHGFSMRVLYSGPRRLPEAEERSAGMTFVPLDDLLRQSDFVSLHPPFNADTRHMISDREFKLMKPSAFIVNTARGAIIDEKALVRALKAKRIAGAGLDVFENEPRVAAGLLKMPNVIALPHLGSAVRELREQMANIVVDNVLALLDGKRPPNIVNPDVLG